MKSRIILGSLATILFLREYINVNQIQFQYPFVSQTGKINQRQTANKYQFRKNSWILSIKTPQMFTDRLENLQNNDLVLCQTPEGENIFKIVGAVSRNYTRFQNGVSNYIPPGFVFLVDPVKKEIGMENIAVVTSKTHFSLGKFESWWLNKKQAKKQDSNEPSFERQILQRNKVREQIKQSQIFQQLQNQQKDQ